MGTYGIVGLFECCYFRVDWFRRGERCIGVLHSRASTWRPFGADVHSALPAAEVSCGHHEVEPQQSKEVSIG